MITIRKLYTLKTGTRLRKIIRILEDWERALLKDFPPEREYFTELMKKMAEDEDLNLQVQSAARDCASMTKAANTLLTRRLINSLRHALLTQLEISQADWDFIHPGDLSEQEERKRFPGVALYLDEIRSPFNVGSIFRTAESLGVSTLLLSPGTADPLHPRSLRTSMGCVDRLNWERMDYKTLGKLDTPCFALELGGTSVHDFKFPGTGLMILGSEEVGVSPECLKLADLSLGRTSIPLFGWKGSLNVSVAYGIVMNHWAHSLSD
ncbi:MAG: hypothetical protein B6241_10130 [Spirochaetaceae bacterium 4572_59]|nr:MAG: hypothetical protein B6241_10130 [Spirochaetaceae bacterium 4572_59]